MRDRFFFPLAGALIIGMVLLALVWPRGLGSPSPFGEPAPAKAEKPAKPPAAKTAGLRPAQ
jgi:hypothetical protein